MTQSAQAQAMQGERRIVTILFCDIKGSTAAAEQLDPEEWADIMNGAFERMIQPVSKYEGTVVRLLGDAILAFFGAPIANEDDPQRAVMAALEIVEAISAYRTDVQHRWNIELDVRCGINTGLVVVGAVGSDLHLEYSALGDAVNLAARMEQSAQPGTVQIAEETYRAVAPYFDVEDLGAIEVKGKEVAVHSYRIVAANATPERLRRMQRLASPLIGRDAQFSVLRSAAQRLQQGVGSIIFLVGEAGLGKSRLIHELRLACEALERRPSWFETTSLSYEMSQPYGQFQRLMRSVCAINSDDAPDLAREKISQLLTKIAIREPEQTRRVMEALLNLEETSAAPRLEGETFKTQLHAAMKRLWQSWADTRPAVLVFDDLHWADPASTELLLHLFELSDQAALLIVCAMRPDRQSFGWDIRVEAESRYPHRYSEINLGPLSQEESNGLVDSLLGVSGLPRRLQESMQEKAAGNPFFMEEVVHSLIDSGALVIDEQNQRRVNVQSVADIDIPDNLQSLLMARIDRLDQPVRQTMQLAAVIGRSFHYRVLARIAGGDTADLKQQVLQLLQSDLIHESARLPELEYTFRHVLVQEAAYNMILNRQRRQYHRRVGETLESIFPEHVEENASLLAYHFDESRVHRRALFYHRMAGDAAYRLFAAREASGHYGRALALTKQFVLESQTEGEGDAQEDDRYDQFTTLYTQLGRVYELSAQFDQALAVYEEMETVARENDKPTLKLAALMAQATLYAIPSPKMDNTRGETLSEEALELARGLGDRAAESKILWILMWLYMDTGRQHQALDLGERSLVLARELGLREQTAFALSDLARCYLQLGRFEEAKTVSREAMDLWRELDNLPMMADSQGALCGIQVLTGEYDQAITVSEDAYQLSQSIGNTWGQSYSLMRVGLAHWERGRPDRAIAAMEESLSLSESSGFVVPQMLVRADLASIYGDLGQIERGLETAHVAHDFVKEKYPLFRAYTLGTLAQLTTLHGDYAAAGRLIAQSRTDPKLADRPTYYWPTLMAAAELALKQGNFQQAAEEVETLLEIGFQIYVPRALHLQAQVLLGLGQEEVARQRLLEARSQAQATGSQWNLWRIFHALSQMAADAEETQLLRRQSQEVLRPIVEAIPTTELRASFLALPDVQALLS